MPRVGPARAGLPEPADAGQATEALSVESFLVDRPDQTVYCRMKDESMRDAGLLDGDIAVVDRSVPAQAGDMVLAAVEGELTVKWLRAVSKTIAARQPGSSVPTAPRSDPSIPQRSLEILGVVAGSFRRCRRWLP
ncbi:LexA family protein [Roseateles sp.]|uniref:LexA family protein n=1 Tax=Roseateles sp. TaxID=1971397 RepID=UPI0039E81F8F